MSITGTHSDEQADTGLLGVVGGGAWGTALATAAARIGTPTRLWAREAEVVSAVIDRHENTLFLPGCPLDPRLKATDSLADMADCAAVLLVTPAQYLRPTLDALKPHLQPGTPLVICAKGIEVASGKLLSDVVTETAPGHPVLVLSGPTFAGEAARGLPCALTLATTDQAAGARLMAMLGQPTFRLYLSNDIIGAQIGGAIKNVLAIATGMVAGLGLGENARAATITRGLAEIMRFGALFGARQETLMGLSGLGDLILTCSSTQSRNMSLGKALGEGHSLESLMAGRTSVAEGAHTVEIVHRIATEKGVDMPITEAVHAILREHADVRETLSALLARPFRSETA
ncbi:NAD(P)H-dependent glycerol-3-phosphate dehydrogenase [Yunchengibacter salinarum]|uniref:NAD(P)H-dependent glycerol-3-phosphate dehydrogenase n=1 Tax=Yunchengibacter salinarum TaxID=3133399 RepID=UPI0035B5BCC8